MGELLRIFSWENVFIIFANKWHSFEESLEGTKGIKTR